MSRSKGHGSSEEGSLKLSGKANQSSTQVGMRKKNVPGREIRMFKGREKFHVEWNMKIKWMPANQLIKRLDTHEAEIDGKGDIFRIGKTLIY